MVDKALVIKDFTETMKNHYGARLSKIILYGSYARGDFNEESDIDFANPKPSLRFSYSKYSFFVEGVGYDFIINMDGSIKWLKNNP